MVDNYASLPAKQVLAKLGSSATNGLTTQEAHARLKQYGHNKIETRKRKTTFSMLLNQFSSPLVLILIFASFISSFLGEFVEAAVIIAIVLINALLGFAQEYKSELALERLARYLRLKAKVLRDGKREVINAEDLVPGDIVSIETGDIIPADLRLLTISDLQVNQSILTGESLPVPKTIRPSPRDARLPQEMSCIAFAGTNVKAGAGIGVVIATGGNTEFGKTAAYLKEKPPQTDFEKNIKLLGDMLIAVIVVVTIFIFAANSLLGKDILLSLLFALAIAVGITPEMLPMVITLSLSNGGLALASKKVVVRRLDAIEDLGNVDVLCSDKTGTLTENAITLRNYISADGKEDDSVLFYSLLASPVAIGRKHKYVGLPMDTAIWEYAKNKPSLVRTISQFRIIDEIAFDYERRMVSVVVASNKQMFFVTKGSPESVIPRCTKVLLSGVEADIGRHAQRLLSEYKALSAQGLRVLGVAIKKPEKKKDYTYADERDLTFVGFVVFTDPPRKTAPQAVKNMKSLGVELKILSGDEPNVTAGICSAVGMEIKGGVVLTGAELSRMNREELRKAVEEFNVFARLTPKQKLEIVSALKENGHVVGFIGDGVNDAPALNSADVGISVDTGADIAKTSADIVLLGHGLHVVVDGIIEGRKIFSNTIKYILNTISANFGNMFTVAISSLFLPFIPLLPSQILLNNFFSDIPLTTISTDRVDTEDLRKPKKWSISGITRFMMFFGMVSSVFDLITIGFLLYFVKAGPELFRTGWFIESALSEIVVTFAIRTKKPFFISRPSNLLLISSILTAIATVGIIYSPLAPLFEFAQPDAGFIAILLGIVIAYLFVAEICKHIFFRFCNMWG